MPSLKKGLFITFEGPEGSGKSTQSAQLSEALVKEGYDVVTTREPGGTSIGQMIRTILLEPKNTSIARLTEVLLFAADRAQHLAEKVLPAIEAKKIVICDRYVDSTTAYQIGGRGLDKNIIDQLNDISMRGCMPVRTYLLDIPVEQGLTRATRKGQDRFEKEIVDFHERVRNMYLAIAKKDPQRVQVFSGLDPIEVIHQDILKDMHNIIKKHAQ